MQKKVDIITVIITALITIGWYFSIVSPYYLVPLLIAYLGINIVGSSNIQLNYFYHSYCSSITSKKEIAITFDDGPHPDITPKLLELLSSNKSKATFFCKGKNVAIYPGIVNKIVSHGHTVGNHSYNHSKYFDLFSSAKMQQEIIDTNGIIKLITEKTPVLFRPPYGVTNPMLRKALNNSNMTSIGWSLRSWDTVRSSDKVLAKLKASTKPGDIILFHDTNPNIIKIIEDYLNWLQKNDFKIVSLTTLLNIPAYED